MWIVSGWHQIEVSLPHPGRVRKSATRGHLSVDIRREVQAEERI